MVTHTLDAHYEPSTVVILASGSIEADLRGDIGPTDVSWLPFGGRPLLHSLLDQLDSRVRLVLTVPLGRTQSMRVFTDRFEDSVVIERSPDDSLPSVAAEALAQSRGPTTLLFGDTLAPLPESLDEIRVGSAIDVARWTTVRRSESGRLEFSPRRSTHHFDDVVIGAFSVSNPQLLADCLKSFDPSIEPFFEALLEYEHRARVTMCLRPTPGWLDLGHLDTFHEARRRSLQSRSFNELTYCPERSSILKSSTDTDKLKAEHAWFSEISRTFPSIVPRLVGEPSDTSSYEIEYLAVPTVGESMVCGAHDLGYWQRLLRGLTRVCDRLHEPVGAAAVPKSAVRDSRAMLLEKTTSRLRRVLTTPIGQRLADIETVNGVPVPSLSDAVSIAALLLERAFDGSWQRWSRIHGDLFFGNMFFDRRADRVILIDPRGRYGVDPSVHSTFGDPLYDLAKLAHSMFGRYDYIVADMYTLSGSASNIELEVHCSPCRSPEALVQLFEPWIRCRADRLGVTVGEVRAAEAMCFLSLLPLHAENPKRQLAFAAIGLAILADVSRALNA